MSSLSTMQENVYLKWRICEALGLQMIVVLKRLNVGKHLKNINSALSLLHDVSVMLPILFWRNQVDYSTIFHFIKIPF